MSDTRYCEICKNINQLSTKTDKILFICTACANSREGTSEDTLIDTDNTIELLDAYRNLIKFGRFDIVNPTVERKCQNSSCDSNLMKKIRIGQELKQIFLCTKCDYSEL